jgi:2-polyprenyl-6-methoxyphenol hydroxylase-like FAD-dependent oxidoreductase
MGATLGMNRSNVTFDIQSNIGADEIANIEWDTVVAGAGVSGTAVAMHLASLRRNVLLIEAARFPREKVCGGCLNQRAQRELNALGVLSPLLELGAVRLDTLQVCVRRRVVRWSMPSLLSVRRSVLDAQLVAAAMERGVKFIQETKAKFPASSVAEVQLEFAEHKRQEIRTKTRVLATGLARSGLPRQMNQGVEGWPSQVASGSRIGVHCLMSGEKPPLLAASKSSFKWIDHGLCMIVGQVGYLGVCRTDSGLIDLAAAIDPLHIQRLGGIGPCIESILSDCDMALNCDPASMPWKATPLLTRQSCRVAQDSTFLVGDSLGYVEPFTGEGMSWGLASAKHLSTLIEQCIVGNHRALACQRWEAWVARHRHRHHRIASWVARQSRLEWNAARVLHALNWMPPIRSWLMRKVIQ